MNSHEILGRVTKDRAFIKFYQEARKLVEHPDHMQNGDNFMNHFVGELWALIAETYLKERVQPGEIFVGPDETFDFYQKLFPGREKIKHLFDRKTLDGVTVPDAMAVDSYQSEAVHILYEFTARQSEARQDQNYFLRKLGVYSDQIRLIEELRTARLNFVVPWDTPDYFIRDEAQLTAVPVDHNEFKNFVDDILYTYQRFGPPLVYIAQAGVIP